MADQPSRLPTMTSPFQSNLPHHPHHPHHADPYFPHLSNKRICRAGRHPPQNLIKKMPCRAHHWIVRSLQSHAMLLRHHFHSAQFQNLTSLNPQALSPHSSSPYFRQSKLSSKCSLPTYLLILYNDLRN